MMAAAVFSCPPQVQTMGDGDPTGEEDSSVSSTSSSSLSNSCCADSIPPTNTTINSNNATANVPLMLEGDVLAVSLDGISRSCYHLVTTATTTTNDGAGSALMCIEERYDLRRARKKFLIREMDESGGSSHLRCSATNLSDQDHGRLAPMGGRLLGSVDVQEVDQGCGGCSCPVYHSPLLADGRAGGDQTGGSTWEASIAMALYFAAHEEQSSLLSGRVIELGCGVGLGGILTTQLGSLLLQQQQQQQHTTENSRDSSGTCSTITSVTLTDGNEQVLHECRRNVQAALLAATSLPSNNKMTLIPPVFVKRLDWNNIPHEDRHRYNVVVACDVVYRYADVEPLGMALEELLVQRQENGQDSNGQPAMMIHLFAPYNRGALEHLSVYLREALDLQVDIEWVEMHRYRLKPQNCNNSNNKKSCKNANINSFSSSLCSDQQWWRDYPELIKTDKDLELGDAVEDDDDRAYASKSTAKFLHITATRKEARNSSSNKQNEHKSSSSLDDID
jgi:Lysine methyltransferase